MTELIQQGREWAECQTDPDCM